MMVGRFSELCRRRGLKVNAIKSKVLVLGREEGLECEVCVNGIRLEHVSEFKYLGCVLDESGTDEAECCRNVASGRRVGGLEVLLGLWLVLGFCSLSVLGSFMSPFWCLFLRMAVRQ